MLGEERFEIRPEGEHDFLRLRTRVKFGISSQITEKHQSAFAELPEDSFSWNLGFNEAARGADELLSEETIGISDQGFEHLPFQRAVKSDEFINRRFQSGFELAFGLVEVFENGGLLDRRL